MNIGFDGLNKRDAAKRGTAERRGFTLIELLLVIAIIGVLVAILLGALGEVFGRVATLKCQDQLRHIATAHRQYVSDSRGLWPPILTQEAPALALARLAEDTGLRAAPPRPAADWGQAGPHWSIVLWPYLRSIEMYTCPADPQASRRGEAIVPADKAHAVALHGAPPESYGLNVILFRTSDDLRRQAGCTWGTRGDADYNGLTSYTTRDEQRRQFPHLARLVLYFCGTRGQTVGSQYNIAWRTGGLVDRVAWHPRAAEAAFADEPGSGSNYLFADGRVEYRDACPSPLEWGIEMPSSGPLP